MTTRRIISVLLCFVMIFTAIPFSFTASADEENPIIELKLPQEVTLFKDSFYTNSSIELNVEVICEREDEEPTGLDRISWRILDENIVRKGTNKNYTTMEFKAEKIGTTWIYAEIADEQTGEIIVQSSCKVTVRKSLKAYSEEIKSFINGKVPSDIDDKDPTKYSSTSLAELDAAYLSIEEYFGVENSEKTFIVRGQKITELISEMEDTAENCILVDNWGTDIMMAVLNVINSPIAQEYDTAYWERWEEAYNIYLNDYLEDIENDVYIAETVSPVNDIIEEFSKTEWIKNDECKNKLADLADRLVQALSFLKKHTTYFSLKYERITKTYGCDPFKIQYETNGEDEIEWQSSDSAIATVDNGTVTIRTAIPENHEEYVEISAVSNSIRSTCKLYIKNPISSIEVEEGIVVSLGVPKQLEVEVHTSCDGYPATETLQYISDNTSVATVDENGMITPISKGSCKIIISVKDDLSITPATCYVTVKEDQKITSVVLISSSMPQVTVNDITTIKLRVSPLSAKNKEMEWTSSDESVAVVSGLPTDEKSQYVLATVRGVKEGQATITYKTTDGSDKSGSVTVTVNPLVSEIKLDKTEIVTFVKSDDEIKLKAVCYPENAGNQLLDWESSDETVATVVDGKVSVIKAGECMIRAIARDGSGVFAEAKLLVLGSAKSIQMSKAPALMNTGETFDLDCSVVTAQDVVYEVRDWSVSDTSLAKIDENGVITALLPGTVTVTARYFDGTSAVASIVIYAPLKGISLPSALTLATGSVKALTPTYTPTYASNKNVTWSTSDSSVVSISTTGVVSAVGVGTANVTARSEEGGYVAVCQVTVYQPVTGLSLSKSSYTLTIGKTSSIKLTATVYPSNATDKRVIWSSSNENVASVSDTGVVTAVGPGTATITAKTHDGGYEETCQIIVIQPVQSIDIQSSLSLYVGQKYTLNVTFYPSDATDKSVTFSSSKTSVATVDNSGNITAKAVGTCEITARSADGGYTDVCTVTVTPKIDVSKVTISEGTVSVMAGATHQLSVVFTPGNASNKAVTWSSSNTAVASVNSKGVVTGHVGGMATIKCVSADTGVSDTCKVIVVENPTSITLGADSITLYVGKTKTISANVLPATATNKTVNWRSSNNAIAKVDSSGVITAVSGGVCDIIATCSANSSITARCRVTVLQAPSSIDLNKTSMQIMKGDKAMLTAQVLPQSCFDKSVTWSSNKTSVATVSSSGVVSAVSAGTAVITCSSVADPNVKKTCTVTVYQPVTGVSLSAERLTLTQGRTKKLIVDVQPSKATNKKVTFRTSNKNIVTVSSTGKLEAINPGRATITVCTEDGFFTASCTVTVLESPGTITLSKKKTTISIGKSKTLKAKLTSKTATKDDLIWRSSNPLVARVTKSGKVTAKSEGTATITCMTKDGTIKATCKVTCIIAVKSVSLSASSVTIKKGKTKKLKAKLKPKDATIKDVTWSSSNKSVAKVDKNGKIKAVGKGKCVITCKTKQGGKKVTCKVKVN